jgi:hypothetical protein
MFTLLSLHTKTKLGILDKWGQVNIVELEGGHMVKFWKVWGPILILLWVFQRKIQHAWGSHGPSAPPLDPSLLADGFTKICTKKI